MNAGVGRSSSSIVSVVVLVQRWYYPAVLLCRASVDAVAKSMVAYIFGGFFVRIPLFNVVLGVKKDDRSPDRSLFKMDTRLLSYKQQWPLTSLSLSHCATASRLSVEY